MRALGENGAFSGLASERTVERLLRGRLGEELARIYGDLVDAPIPSHLRTIIERLDLACAPEAEDGQDPA